MLEKHQEDVYCVLFYFLKLDVSLHECSLSSPKLSTRFFLITIKSKNCFLGKFKCLTTIQVPYLVHVSFLLFVYLENVPVLLSYMKETLTKNLFFEAVGL